MFCRYFMLSMLIVQASVLVIGHPHAVPTHHSPSSEAVVHPSQDPELTPHLSQSPELPPHLLQSSKRSSDAKIDARHPRDSGAIEGPHPIPLAESERFMGNADKETVNNVLNKDEDSRINEGKVDNLMGKVEKTPQYQPPPADSGDEIQGRMQRDDAEVDVYFGLSGLLPNSSLESSLRHISQPDNSLDVKSLPGNSVATKSLPGNSLIVPRSSSLSINPLEDGSYGAPRSIMENFADDFDNTADFFNSDDYFNREPYHYESYYDSVLDPPFEAMESRQENVPEMDMGNYEPAPLMDSPPLVDKSFEMQLLSPNLKDGLSFVLEQLTNQSQRNRRHYVPIRHESSSSSSRSGVPVGPSPGVCPPPVHSLPPGLCSATPCTSHMMCYPNKMCCFNGCTYTCTAPVEPPPVIDWVEDTAARRPLLDPLNPSLPLRFESSPLSYGTGGGETVVLPGGCTLTAKKYAELKSFMTAESIRDCLCRGGEVVCVVKSSPVS